MFGTGDLLARIKEEGFNCNSSFLTYLLRNRIVSAPETRVGGAFVWMSVDVGKLRTVLTQRGRGPKQVVPVERQ